MTFKTISAHYDKDYNLDHNNRIFIPHNVDPNRIPWNYNCVIAGQPFPADSGISQCIDDIWRSYSVLTDLYWSDKSIYQMVQSEEYQEFLAKMRKYRQAQNVMASNPLATFLAMLICPLLIPCEIYLQYRNHQARTELTRLREEQWIRNLTYRASRVALRDALRNHDLEAGTAYLQTLDSVVTEMSKCANNYSRVKPQVDLTPEKAIRYATLEEIYDKLFEPSFREFQQKQRPCRRYEGTYLEQIRDQQAKQIKKKQQTKNAKSRATAEAIEIVIGIGAMENTGYEAAFHDAKKSEVLLKDYCDHLLAQPNICFVTTRELSDSNWQPPFRNGLIILNLTMHADEATPGIHLTCIPYSRNCKRGPSAQASLGRAMTGMGYPSTWRDVLDDKGERVPKRNKNGEIIYNKDGSIRYQQEPDQQGIIDWIEEQKIWIQSEMKKRYNWDREYKGSHSRGNLDTPDYKAAKAKERLEEYEQLTRDAVAVYEDRIYDLSMQLDRKVESQLKNASNQDIIDRYLTVCSDKEYDEIVEKATEHLDKLAAREQEASHQALLLQMQAAEEKRSLNSAAVKHEQHIR